MVKIFVGSLNELDSEPEREPSCSYHVTSLELLEATLFPLQISLFNQRLENDYDIHVDDINLDELSSGYR